MKRIWLTFLIILPLTLLMDLFVTPHVEFGIEGTIFFYAWFGFFSCAVIIIFSRFLGIFLKRKENYYNRELK